MFVRDRVRSAMVWLHTHPMCHQRATWIWAALRVASLYQRLLCERAILPNDGWKICFLILTVQIFTTRLVVLQVLIGSRAKQVFFLSALVILGLSCRLTMFLMGRRTSSIVIVFSWKTNFTPRLCMVCLPIMRSYIGAWSPGLYSTMSGWRQTFLLAKYCCRLPILHTVQEYFRRTWQGQTWYVW